MLRIEFFESDIKSRVLGMATAAAKAEYDEIITPIKKLTDTIKDKLQDLKSKKTVIPSENVKGIIEQNLKIIDLSLEEISNNILISKLAIKILDIKNEGVLNQARKNLYTVIQIFEEMVGREIDTPMTHNENVLKIMGNVIPNLESFEIIKKVAFCLETVEKLYGDNSKWKWSFVELEGRLVTVFKNIIAFQPFFKNLDPSIEGYSDRMDLLSVLNERIDHVSERYRNKYELTGKRIDDMKSALGFVAFKKRIAILLGDTEIADLCKKKYDSWQKKLNDDLENDEK